MYTRLWKLITRHMEENSRMAVFLTSAMLIWTIGIGRNFGLYHQAYECDMQAE